MFSKACEYALKASIFIAKENLGGKLVNVKQTAVAVGAPEAFTAKIMQQLSRENIFISARGKQGGFSITEDKQKEVKIYDIVKIIDGDGIFTGCGLGLNKCSTENPCPIHNEYKPVRENLIHLFQNFSLYDLAQKTEIGEAWLKN